MFALLTRMARSRGAARAAATAAVVATAGAMSAPAGAGDASERSGHRANDAPRVHAQQVLPERSESGSSVMLQAAVAASPGRPRHAVAVSEERAMGGFRAGLRYAWTDDGGATWHGRTLRGLTVGSGGRWDTVAFSTVTTGVDRDAFVATAVRRDECSTAVAVARSHNSGRTFDRPVLTGHSNSCARGNSKVWVAVDTDPASPHHGRVYLSVLIFRENAQGDLIGLQQRVQYSDDDGRTWSSRVPLTGPRTFSHLNTMVVQPGGAVTVVYARFGLDDPPTEFDLVAQTSYDGGATFADPVLVTRNLFGFTGTADTRCCMPVASVDPVTGVIYVPIGDTRFRDDDLNDVLVFRSRDGRHWGRPVVVTPSHQDEPLEHFTPSLGAYGGRVYVAWTLRRASGDGMSDRIRQQVAVSVDGGRSYGRPVTIGRIGDLRFAPEAPNGFAPRFTSDYNTTVAVPGRAYTVWPLPTPADTAPNQTLWAATVTAP